MSGNPAKRITTLLAAKFKSRYLDNDSADKVQVIRRQRLTACVAFRCSRTMTYETLKT